MFITQSDLTAHFGTENLDRFPADKVARAIAESNSIAQSSLAGRYELPFYAVPDSVKAACCDIAARRLFVFDCEQSIQSAHDSAVRWFREVANGNVILVLEEDPNAQVIEPSKSAGVLFSGTALQYAPANRRSVERSGEWVK